MVTKKTLLVAIMLTFCLTSILFMIRTTRSNPSGIGEYDPWIDSNDDGTIDIFDAIMLSNRYATTGTPINKTELLIELHARIDSLNATNLELQSSIDDLNASLTSQINTLTTQMVTLNATIATLESRIATLESPGIMKAPAYDSGWLDISPGQNLWLQHNLNTDPAKQFIYILGDGGAMVNQICLGSDYFYTGENVGRQGLFVWGMNPMNMAVTRCLQDPYWDQVRVQIWIIQ